MQTHHRTHARESVPYSCPRRALSVNQIYSMTSADMAFPIPVQGQ